MRRFLVIAGFVAGALAAAILGLPAPAYSHKPITTNILFKNEVAQIFQRKCFQCHTERNLAMSLLTYTEARPWARAIREEILERRMPPWTAVSGYGHFSNDLSLSTREMEIILSWADGGAPSGVLKAEEPIPPVYVPPAPEWDLGKPDQVISIGTGQVVEAGAPFEIKRVVVTTGTAAATRVRAIALKQGDRRVVRHAAFFEQGSGRWLGSWTPWQTASSLPPGVSHRLPPNARIVVEIGYSGTAEQVTDKSELGLYFVTAAGSTTDTLTLSAPEASVAAGATSHRVRTDTTLANSVAALALWPSPSAGARSIEITATTPEGLVSPLLWIKDYRADWRSSYVLSSPVELARGTRIAMTTYFDNPGEKAAMARATAALLITAATNQERRTKHEN